MQRTAVVPGTEVGAYRVIARIGAGGMGEVWLAEHVTLGRRAAIKLLHAELSTHHDIVTRFFNEARAATAISDPGIVQVFDFGQHRDGGAYIVMELLEGEPLDRRVSRLGALAVIDALRIMRQVATSLGAAHARGIVHRDLKPENIFLVPDAEVAGGERPKILDFGIAKLTGTSAGIKTQTAAMLGTPTYMSPEQCRGAGQLDQRSDVYSLGCLLFTLITGRPPFDAEGIGEIIAMHLREPAPRASSIASGIPHAVDDVIARCLAKHADERFASAAELAAAIARIHPSAASASPVTPAPPVTHSMPTTLSAAVAVRSTKAPAGRRVGWLGVAAVIAVVAIAISIAASSEPELVAVVVPPPVAVRPRDDRRDRTISEIRAALEGFVAWSKQHASAPCPTASELGSPHDGWGRPLAITCSDQPSDQIAGAVSPGPDGIAGTDDDIRSWELGRETIANVKGARWAPVVVPIVTTAPKPQPSPVRRSPPTPDMHGDDIPDRK